MAPAFAAPYAPAHVVCNPARSLSRVRPRMTVARPRPAATSSASASPAPAPAPAPAATPSPAPVTVLSGVKEYLSLLQTSGERLVVLKVFAPWCRSCRALEPKIARLSREFRGEVVFAKLNFEEHKELCHRLGVSAMPTFVFYKGKAGEIDKFSCGPQRAAVIRQKIVQVLDGVCEMADKPC